jgi:hypothetical protein
MVKSKPSVLVYSLHWIIMISKLLDLSLKEFVAFLFFLVIALSWWQVLSEYQPAENPFSKNSFIHHCCNSFPNPLDATLWYMKHICASMINAFKGDHITWLQKWYWYILNFNNSYKNTFVKHQSSWPSVICTLNLCYGNWFSVLITELSILGLKLCNQFDVYDYY